MDKWFVIYTRSDPPCSYCVKLKELLNVYGYDYYECDIVEPETRKIFDQKGFRAVPQVFLADKHIGGYQTTKDYLRETFFENHPKKDLIIKELEELDAN